MASNASVEETVVVTDKKLETVAQSHKGSKLRSYSMQFKLDAIQKAEETSNRHSAQFYGVDVKENGEREKMRLQRWRLRQQVKSEYI